MPLPKSERAFFEARFGEDFSAVRLHVGATAGAAALGFDARAFTLGSDIAFAPGEYAPGTTAGRRLLGHELTHVVQQSRPPGVPSHVQRQVAGAAAAPRTDPRITDDRFTGPLTDQDWQMVDEWLSVGVVGVDPLTGDAAHNAGVIAAAIFCSRAMYDLIMADNEDPLLCLITEVTIADPRVQRLKQNVIARGAIVNWTAVAPTSRMAYVVERLVNPPHRYPVNAAAGIVGNLFAESGVLPSRVEGSGAATPLRVPNFRGRATTFTPQQVMDRDKPSRTGPRAPGVGLAQWTTSERRTALFQQTAGGRQLGASVLFNMDAQVDYLVSELKARSDLSARLGAAGVTVENAADDIVYEFEIPGAILDGKRKRPRSDPAVQAVFQVRRRSAHQALRAYQAAHQP